MPRRIVIADTETASLQGGVCEFAVIEIDEDLKVVNTISSLIDPQTPIMPAAQAVHGISDAMVAHEPTAAEYLHHFGDPFNGDPLVMFGHNIQFDIRMFVQSGFLTEKHRVVPSCTLRMARNLWPDYSESNGRNHKLGTLALIHGISVSDVHRAMADALTTLGLLRLIANESSVGSFEELLALGRAALSPDTKMPFGEHKGKLLRDVPSSYVSWMRTKPDMITKYADLLEAFTAMGK